MGISLMHPALTGKEPSEKVLEEARKQAASMARKPHLAIVLVGEDPASQSYVKKKLEKAAAVGIRATLRKLPADAGEESVLSLVDELNCDNDVDGFIVQSPLPHHIYYPKILARMDPAKDVDGWTPMNMGRMVGGLGAFRPATPLGVMALLEHYKIGIAGKHAVVVGRSNVVGKPLALMLLEKDATVTVCHSRTVGLEEHTGRADILIAAAGKPGLIRADMVKAGACVIDVGTTRVDGRIVGDVDFENVIKKASCSPVPGGVGPMTVAMLIRNVIEAAKSRG